MVEANDLLSEPKRFKIDEIYAECPARTDQWIIHIEMTECDHSGSGPTFFKALANAYQAHLNMGDHE